MAVSVRKEFEQTTR